MSICRFHSLHQVTLLLRAIFNWKLKGIWYSIYLPYFSLSLVEKIRVIYSANQFRNEKPIATCHAISPALEWIVTSFFPALVAARYFIFPALKATCHSIFPALKVACHSIFPALKVIRRSIFPGFKVTRHSIFPALKVTRHSIFPPLRRLVNQFSLQLS